MDTISAQFFDGDDAIVVITRGGNRYKPHSVINFGKESTFAKQFAGVVNSGCTACWGIGGNHNQIFTPTESSGGGEVRGYYADCPNKGKVVVSK